MVVGFVEGCVGGGVGIMYCVVECFCDVVIGV